MDSALLTLLITYRYWILFPVVFIEGPVVALAVGLLISLGYMEIVPAFIIMALGDLVPDFLYYQIGRRSRESKFLEKYGKRFGITKTRLEAIERLWRNHTFKSTLLSKWAYGMSTPLLISAGLAHVPMKKFLPYVLSITVVQYIILITVGYYFGSSYELIGVYVKDVGWIIAGGLILFFLIFFAISKWSKRILLEST